MLLIAIQERVNKGAINMWWIKESDWDVRSDCSTVQVRGNLHLPLAVTHDSISLSKSWPEDVVQVTGNSWSRGWEKESVFSVILKILGHASFVLWYLYLFTQSKNETNLVEWISISRFGLVDRFSECSLWTPGSLRHICGSLWEWDQNSFHDNIVLSFFFFLLLHLTVNICTPVLWK